MEKQKHIGRQITAETGLRANFLQQIHGFTIFFETISIKLFNLYDFEPLFERKIYIPLYVSGFGGPL